MKTFPEVPQITRLSLHTASDHGRVLHLISRRVSPMFDSGRFAVTTKRVSTWESRERVKSESRDEQRGDPVFQRERRVGEPFLDQTPDSFRSWRRPTARSTASLFNFLSAGKASSWKILTVWVTDENSLWSFPLRKRGWNIKGSKLSVRLNSSETSQAHERGTLKAGYVYLYIYICTHV